MAQQVSKLSVLLLFNTEQFDKQLSQVQKRMRRSGRMMQEVGKTMTMGISLPLALIGKRMTETATGFEYQMARVAAVSGSAGKAFTNLQNNAEALGASTIYTAREVAVLQEEFAKLGFSSAEITQVTESTLSLAQVTGADLGRAAEVAGSTLRIFNRDAQDLGQTNDVVAVAISKSALDFESYAETLKYAGSQAAVSGVSMEELSAAMGVLANRGVKGSIAGTRLRMIFAKLAKEGGDTHQKFLDLINGTMTMSEAIDRFGVRAATAVPVLQENREEFFALEKQMRFSAGTLEIMQEKMDDTSFAAQKKLKSALEDVSIQFGKALLPLVNAAASAFTKFANIIAATPTWVKGVFVGIGALLTVMGPLIYALGSLKIAFVSLQFMAPKLATAISAMLGPWGLLLAAVAGVAAAMYYGSQQGSEYAALSERIADANGDAASAAAEVLSPIRKLIAEYDNINTKEERRSEILRQLNELQPTYFKDLDSEKVKVSDLATSYKTLETNVMAAAKARAYQTQLTKLAQDEADLVGKQIEKELEIEELYAKRAEDPTFMEPYTERVYGQRRAGEAAAPIIGYREVDPFQNEVDRKKMMITHYQNEIDKLSPFYQKIQDRIDALGVDPTGGTTAGAGGGSLPSTALDTEEKLSSTEKAMQRLAKALAVIEKESESFGTKGVELTEKKISAYEAAFKSLVEATVEGESVGDNLTSVTKSLTKLKEQLLTDEDSKAYNDAMEEMAKRTAALDAAVDLGMVDELERMQAQHATMKTTLDELIPLLGTENWLVQTLANSYNKLGKEIEDAQSKQKETNKEVQLSTQIHSAAIGIAQKFGDTLGSAAGEGKSFGAAIASGIRDAVVATLQLAFAQHVQNALNPNNPANASTLGLAGLAAAAAGVGILTGIINSINIPELAKGGIAVGSQLAVVGDNRSGREAIIPLERLPGLVQKMGGGGNQVLYGSLRGQDIHVSNQRGARTKQRIL